MNYRDWDKIQKDEYILQLGMALGDIVRAIPEANYTDEIDDELKFIEVALIHYIQLKFDGVEDNG